MGDGPLSVAQLVLPQPEYVIKILIKSHRDLLAWIKTKVNLHLNVWLVDKEQTGTPLQTPIVGL